MSERINKLESLLSGAWEQVKLMARNRDRAAAQNALDKVAHLENLKQQEVALEKSIEASLSNDFSPEASASAVNEKKHGSVITGRGKRPTVRPKEVKIGSYQKNIHYAYEIPITVANWLVAQGKALPSSHNFVHPSQSGFAASAITKQLASGQFIEVGDNQEVLLQKARRLLDVCGYHGQGFEVLFADGKRING